MQQEAITRVSENNPALYPVTQANRMHILDILRGFAVFGILAVNIAGWAGPSYLPGYVSPQDIPIYDQIAEYFVLYLADGKFFTIFSFLFGLGFSVQLSRAEAKGRQISSFYPRRLLVLLAFGVIHTLFWVDDILRLYALLGFILLLFRHRSNRELLAWAGVFFALGYVFSLTNASFENTLPNLAGPARDIYRNGSFLTVAQFQIWAGIYMFLLVVQIQGANVMSLFLLGFLAGRVKFFEKLPENRGLLQKTMAIGLLTGIVLNTAHHWLDTTWLANLDFIIGALGLSAAYTSGLCLLSLRETGAKLLTPLGQVGRMALSNYMLQSIICSFIFNGYGLGFYEKIGQAGLVGLTVVIYLAQVLISNWWLSRFQFGPLEWVWRSLTYGQRQPFLKR